MKSHKKRRQLLTWICFATVVLLNSAGVFLSRQSRQAYLQWFEYIFPITLITFAFVGALIIAQRPQNRIGFLVMLPGASLAPFTDGVVAMFTSGLWPVPQPPSLLYFLFLWFAGWNWVLLIFPLLYLLILFPTGHSLSPRWRWLLYSATLVMLVIPVLGTFAEQLDANGYEVLAVANPIGFISAESLDNSRIIPFFFVAMPVCVALSVLALFVRFRRARGAEREQIKWLFWAGAVFATTYIPTFVGEDFVSFTLGDSLWTFGMMTVPIAIGIAILRHRLFDIDVLIRKTAQYGVVTAVLALVYFGTVILLQNLVDQATGEQSPIIIVLSTLLIAALFNPLRQRVQAFIDRRFYRQKYDAQQILAQFAQTARDEVEMDILQAELLRVVQETLQPQEINILVQKAGHNGRK